MRTNPAWRNDFPILLNGNSSLIYLDSAATSLKPKSVINAVSGFHYDKCSSVHRSTHLLTEKASNVFNSAREKVASFINAQSNEIIFTHNTTDSINMVANGLNLKADDEIIISILEHHSNVIPWQQHSVTKTALIDDSGIVDIDQLEKLITKKTKLIAISYVSNVTGKIQPIRAISKIAREHGILLLVDSAQAVGHIPVDVIDIDCDFLTFSSHKMLGPSGVGILYGKATALNKLNPSRFGGGMVNKVSGNDVQFHNGPQLFEAGTPNVEGVTGLGVAIDYLNELGLLNVYHYLKDLDCYFKQKLHGCTSLKSPFNYENDHVSIFSLLPLKAHCNLDFIAGLLSDTYGIALRSGFHCAQPLFSFKNLSQGCLRVSLHLYNTKDDIDSFFDAIKNIHDLIV